MSDAESVVPRLSLRGMRRSFGRVRAVRDVDLDVAPGSIHALLGENGAGKSTLMNIVYGIHSKDAGVVRVDGSVIDVASPAQAIRAGLAMVHQHDMLIPSLTAAETIALTTPSRRVTWNARRAAARVRELSGRLGIGIDPETKVEDLSLAGRQRLEILTAVHRDAQVLILDEPTAVLAPSEVEPFFALLRAMAGEGRSIILITHRMREVFAVCDHISVMRKGRLVFSAPTTTTSRDEVLSHVVTSASVPAHDPEASHGGRVVAEAVPALELRSVSLSGVPGTSGLDACDLSAYAGEVLGVAGVEGNGQDDLVALLAGVRASDSGEVRLRGATLSGRPDRDLLTIVPPDRHREGLILDLSVAENLVIDHLGDYTRLGILERRRMRAAAGDVVREFDVKTATVDSAVRRMSGGNQQKVVLARALGSRPQVLVTSQATRGLDPGVARAVLDRIRQARDAGTAVVYIGSDLDEIIDVADRVCVLYGGRVSGTTASPATDRDLIAAWMVGAGPEAEENA